MNSSMVTTSIILVASIMSLEAFAPIVPNAQAAIGDEGACPTVFEEILIDNIANIPDQTRADRIDRSVGLNDGLICIKELPQRTVLVDNILPEL